MDKCNNDRDNMVNDSNSNKNRKLKRTLESGHSDDQENIFETGEDFVRYWEEDELYED